MLTTCRGMMVDSSDIHFVRNGLVDEYVTQVQESSILMIHSWDHNFSFKPLNGCVLPKFAFGW